jgi:hypothetical protein
MGTRDARLMAFTVALMVSLPAARGQAETRRIAIALGNNAGGPSDTPLRFAENDAGKMARVLVELAGFAPGDLLLLQGRRLDDLTVALETARAQIARWHEQPDTRVLFLFYFSGHSDGQALELGPDRLTFTQLRAATAALAADVRLVVLDSCRSGSVLQSKGGRPAKAFDIHFADDLSNSGEALITSSAWDESSLESPEIRGSFFTHHLVTGLRGAADTSGDGRVSLAEAYDYAYAHTIAATADTLSGSQHPSFDYRLSGRGELVLTELRGRAAGLVIPAGYDRVLITHLARDQVVAEVTADRPSRLTLQAGVYTLRAWRGLQEYVSRVTLREGEDRNVQAADLVRAVRVAAVAKLSSTPIEPLSARNRHQDRPLLSVTMGLTSGVAQQMSPMVTGRIGLRTPRRQGWTVDIAGAFGQGQGFDEFRFLLLAGYRLQWSRGVVSIALLADVGGGVIGQKLSDGARLSPGAGASSSVELAWRLAPALGLALRGGVLGAGYEREGALSVSAWPEVLAGFYARL